MLQKKFMAIILLFLLTMIAFTGACFFELFNITQARAEENEQSHIGWTALTDKSFTGGELSSGNYYLADDIKLSQNIIISSDTEVTLCLNGKTLTGSGSGAVITVKGKLILYDCGSMQSGKITGGSGSFGGGVSVYGSFIMNGGSIYGNNASYYGGGVCVIGGTFTLNKGNITANTASYYGGGVYITGGTFYMNGGNISGNTKTNYGGGVYVSGGTFNMSGGYIYENTAKYSGGGIYISGDYFTMTGGYLGNNIAPDENDLCSEAAADIYGGYFSIGDTELNQVAESVDVASSSKVVYINQDYCDLDYNSSFPYAVYSVGDDADVELSLAQKNFVYDGTQISDDELEVLLTVNGNKIKEFAATTTFLSDSAPVYVGEYQINIAATYTYLDISCTPYKIYTFAEKTLTFTITAKQIEILWEGQILIYNGQAQLPSAMVNNTDIMQGDELSVTVKTESQAIEPGNYTAYAVCDNNNYEILNPQFDFEIINTDSGTDGGTPEGTEGGDTAEGTEGEDTAEGTEGGDTAEDTEGEDTSEGTEGGDTAEGTEGEDTSEGTEGEDTAEDTEGEDTAEGTEGGDTAEGTEGEDTSEGTEGEDTAEDTEGEDTADEGGDSIENDSEGQNYENESVTSYKNSFFSDKTNIIYLSSGVVLIISSVVALTFAIRKKK